MAYVVNNGLTFFVGHGCFRFRAFLLYIPHIYTPRRCFVPDVAEALARAAVGGGNAEDLPPPDTLVVATLKRKVKVFMCIKVARLFFVMSAVSTAFIL